MANLIQGFQAPLKIDWNFFAKNRSHASELSQQFFVHATKYCLFLETLSDDAENFTTSLPVGEKKQPIFYAIAYETATNRIQTSNSAAYFSLHSHVRDATKLRRIIETLVFWSQFIRVRD